MKYTAAELFPDWYNKGINKEATAEELAIRRTAISKIVEIETTEEWISIIKVYLGISKIGSTEYEAAVELAKEGDENFLIKSENLVRIILGCALGQKIDKNETYVSDVIALALIASEILPSFDSPIEDLLPRANEFWLEECESKRDIDVEFKVGSPITSDVKVEIPELSSDQTTWKANSDAVIKIIKALQKDLNTANEEIISQQTVLKTVKKNFVALSEETDVLWWLFGGYSRSLKKPFNKFKPEFLSVLISFELYNLTKSDPGIGGIESIIHKALSYTEYEHGSTFAFEIFINSIKEHEAQFAILVPKEKAELQSFTPTLSAIRSRLGHAGNEWQALFKKASTMDLDKKLSYETFSFQLYKELMLEIVYECSK